MLVTKANMDDPDRRSSLIWVCGVCLQCSSMSFWLQQAASFRNFRTFIVPIPLVLKHNLLIHILALIRSKDIDKQSMEVDDV